MKSSEPGSPQASEQAGAAVSVSDRNRVLQRWLELVMRRASLDELAERPLAELVAQLSLLLEIVEQEATPELAPPRGDPLDDLASELERQLAAYDRFGHCFSLLLFAVEPGTEPPPLGPGAFAGARSDSARRAYAEVLTTRARGLDRVLESGSGTIAMLLPACEPEGATVAGERLAEAIAAEVGGTANWSVASCPSDGVTVEALLEQARGRLRETAGPAALDGPEALSA